MAKSKRKKKKNLRQKEKKCRNSFDNLFFSINLTIQISRYMIYQTISVYFYRFYAVLAENIKKSKYQKVFFTSKNKSNENQCFKKRQRTTHLISNSPSDATTRAKLAGSPRGEKAITLWQNGILLSLFTSSLCEMVG